MKLRRSKTDKKDAALIARYGEVNHPSMWNPPTHNQLKSQQLISAIDLHTKSINQFKNQIHAFSKSGINDKEVLKTIAKSIKHMESVRVKLEKDLMETILPDFEKEFTLLSSIPGIGPSTVCLFLTKIGNT